MLDFNVFTEGITKIESAFGKDLKQGGLNVYYESLKQIDEERFKRAVDRILREDTYFPKIKDFFIETVGKASFWEEHSLFWEIDKGILKSKVVPKGEGNKKPEITYNYEEMSEEQRDRNKKRVRELINKVINIGRINYNHQEILQAAQRLGRIGRVRIEEEIIEEKNKLKEAKEELANI